MLVDVVTAQRNCCQLGRCLSSPSDTPLVIRGTVPDRLYNPVVSGRAADIGRGAFVRVADRAAKLQHVHLGIRRWSGIHGVYDHSDSVLIDLEQEAALGIAPSAPCHALIRRLLQF